jgi:hypothetical protein
MKYWLLASAIALSLLSGSAMEGAGKPANETNLGGLRPGKDTMRDANHKFKGLIANPSGNGDTWFEDPCNNQYIEFHGNAQGVIATIVVGNGPRGVADCVARAYSRTVRSRLGSGRGLLLEDPCSSAANIYGKPESERVDDPSNSDIKSLNYDFSRVGSKVPQVLQIQCSISTNQVVKMTLSASKT